MDVWVSVRTDGWMDDWMHGWGNFCFCFFFLFYLPGPKTPKPNKQGGLWRELIPRKPELLLTISQQTHLPNHASNHPPIQPSVCTLTHTSIHPSIHSITHLFIHPSTWMDG